MQPPKAPNEITRRTFLKGLGVAGGATMMPGLLAACAPGNGEEPGDVPDDAGPLDRVTSGQLIWADYGGSTRAARDAAHLQPFADAAGIQVVFADASPPRVVAMARGEDAEWDAIHFGDQDMERLFIEFGEDIPPLRLDDDVPRDEATPSHIAEYMFGAFFLSNCAAFRTDEFDDTPGSWADFFDVDRFPGRRAWPSSAFGRNQFEPALLADGVAPEDLYPMDYERAKAKLSELAPHMLFYEQFPQVQQFLSTGSAVFGFAPNGLFAPLIADEEPIEIIWNEALLRFDGFVIPPDAPNPDAAMAAAAYMHDPERQAAFAAQANYGPGNTDAFDYMDEETLARLPNSPDNQALAVEVPAAVSAEVRDEYEAELEQWFDSL